MRNIFPAIQKSPRRRRAVAGVLIALLVGTLGLSITSTPAFAGASGQQLQLYFPPKFNVHHVSVKGTNNYNKTDAETNFDYSSDYGWYMPGWYWQKTVTVTVTMTYDNNTFTQDVPVIVPEMSETWRLPEHRNDWFITTIDFFQPTTKVLHQVYFGPEINAHQPLTITEIESYPN